MEKSIDNNSIDERVPKANNEGQEADKNERIIGANSATKENVSMVDNPVVNNNSISIKQDDNAFSNKNNHVKTSKNMANDSIQKPLVYPFIEENEDYIRIFIYNPEAGKEGDLIHFYDKTYWDLVGLYPEVDILDDIFPDDKDEYQALQKGGDDGDKDELSGPYKYFKGIIELFFKRNDKDKSISVIADTGDDKKAVSDANNDTNKNTVFDMYKDTTVEDDTDAKNTPPSLFGLNPVNPNTTLNADKKEDSKENQKDGVKEDAKQDNKPVSSPLDLVLSNEPSVKSDGNAIVLTFFPNDGFKFFVEVLESRNPDLDIDITQSKYKFKELDKIDKIKNKKSLSTDISVEEVFYINGKLIVLKGMLNINANGAVKVASNEIFIETKKEMSGFMMDKIKSFDVVNENPFF
jgi:hypothetical protein